MASYLLYLILFFLAVGFLSSPYWYETSLFLYGLFFGTCFFLFFPLLYLLINHSLPAPSFFPLLHDIILEDETGNFSMLFWYLCGIFAIYVLLKILHKKTPRPLKRTSFYSQERWVYAASIILYFSLSLFILYSSGLLSAGHWYDTRNEYILETGSQAIILLYLVWGLRLIIVSYTFELLEKKSISLFTAGLIFLIISFYELFYTGNRIIVVLFGVAGFLFFIRKWGFYKSFLRLVLIAMLIFPLALFMAMFQNARYLIFRTSIPEVLLYTMNLVLNTKVNAIFDPILTIFEYVDVVTMFNLFEDLSRKIIHPVYGETILKTFTWIIPRSLWAAKPEGITLLVARNYLPSHPGASLVPLVFGEFAFNFGILGPVIFPFIALIVLEVIMFLNSKIFLNTYINFLVGFLFIRMPVSDIIIFSIFGVLTYLTLSLAVNLLATYNKRKTDYSRLHPKSVS